MYDGDVAQKAFLLVIHEWWVMGRKSFGFWVLRQQPRIFFSHGHSSDGSCPVKGVGAKASASPAKEAAKHWAFQKPRRQRRTNTAVVVYQLAMENDTKWRNLQALKQLHNQNFITDTEYRTRLKQLIDEVRWASTFPSSNCLLPSIPRLDQFLFHALTCLFYS
jgi:hypothetical protein